MGNADLVFIFNDEVAFIINGIDYSTRLEAIKLALREYEKYCDGVMEIADNPEELNFDIRKIEIFALYKED